MKRISLLALAAVLAAVAGCSNSGAPQADLAACPGIEKTAPAFAQRHAKKRLVCLDLDATLCQHRTIPPPENLAALRELEKRYKCIMVGAGNAPRIYKQRWGTTRSTSSPTTACRSRR